MNYLDELVLAEGPKPLLNKFGVQCRSSQMKELADVLFPTIMGMGWA